MKMQYQSKGSFLLKKSRFYRASGRIVAARKMDFCTFKLRYMQKQEHFLKPQDVDFLVNPRDVQKSQE